MQEPEVLQKIPYSSHQDIKPIKNLLLDMNKSANSIHQDNNSELLNKEDVHVNTDKIDINITSPSNLSKEKNNYNSIPSNMPLVVAQPSSSSNPSSEQYASMFRKTLDATSGDGSDRGLKKKILMIFTGGTIGMSKDADGVLKPSKGFLDRTLANFPEINHPDIPAYDILEWDTPIDSSDFTPVHWAILAKQIAEHYLNYDGFVILHGTDTMAFTASALSFMLENLGKAVILTGSMIPLEEPVSDAKRNLLVSMMVAAHLNVNEVLLFFNTCLLRGNRAKKTDPWKLAAIESPNLEPLAVMGVGIHVRSRNLLRPPSHQFKCHTNMFPSIVVLSLSPGFCYNSLISIATEWKKTGTSEPPAIVLLLYGSGNAPIKNPDFARALHVCLDEGCPVIVMSQCIRGSVDLSQYEAGDHLSKLGVIDGKDMTIEACTAKIAYLMGRGLRGSRLKVAMETDLRGELTAKSTVSYTGYALGNQGLLAKL